MQTITRKSTLSFTEAGTVTAICFGLFILVSVQALMDGFPAATATDAGNAWVVGVELTLGAAALFYLHLRGFDIASLYPAPTVPGSVVGVGVAGAAWLVAMVVTALFHSPGDVDRVAFSVEGVSAIGVVALSVVNGTYEEVFLLGVLMRGLRGFGLSVALGVPLLVRVLYHVYQGPLGVVQVGAAGLALSLSYVVTQRLWPAVLAHILLDVLAFL